MYLLIFESIGTSELILIGIVALIFLGPRRLPEIARKAGKIMADLRSTTNEFKETWQREVDFDEEKKALSLETVEREAMAKDIGKVKDVPDSEPLLPAVSEVEPTDAMLDPANERSVEKEPAITPENDKRNWL